MDRAQFDEVMQRATKSNGRVRVKFAAPSEWIRDGAFVDALGSVVHVRATAAAIEGSEVVADVVELRGDVAHLVWEGVASVPVDCVRIASVPVDCVRIASAVLVGRTALQLEGVDVVLEEGSGGRVGDFEFDRTSLRELAEALASHLGLELRDALSEDSQPLAPVDEVGRVYDVVDSSEIRDGCLYYDDRPHGTKGPHTGYLACVGEHSIWLYDERDADLDLSFRDFPWNSGTCAGLLCDQVQLLATGLRTRDDVRAAIAKHRAATGRA